MDYTERYGVFIVSVTYQLEPNLDAGEFIDAGRGPGSAVRRFAKNRSGRAAEMQ